MKINFIKSNPRKSWGFGLFIFGSLIFLLTMLLAEIYDNPEMYKLGLVIGVVPFCIPGYFIFASGFFEKDSE